MKAYGEGENRVTVRKSGRRVLVFGFLREDAHVESKLRWLNDEARDRVFDQLDESKVRSFIQVVQANLARLLP